MSAEDSAVKNAPSVAVLGSPDSSGPGLECVTLSVWPGEVIGKLASSRFYVSMEATVYSLAEGLEKSPGILGVGVVDGGKAPVGIVLRQELFDNLGRMYGRDLYKRKLVPEVMKTPRVFRDDTNIFSVADVLNKELTTGAILYYVLVDGSGRYSGIFSTIDLLIYLSNITSRDISLARRLQTAIVKQTCSMSGRHTALLGSSAMAKEVGGDFYVLKRLVDGKLLLAICDVSGKGIAASLITAVLGGFFDRYSKSNTMKSFVSTLNRYVIGTFSLEYFVTGIIIEFDEDTGSATICDLGHSYMLVMEGAKLKRLSAEAANPPLGVIPELAPVIRTYHLASGSLLVLFTDGVSDQTDSRGRSYTEQRLWSLLTSCEGLSPEQLAGRLNADLAAFRGEAPQRDDITFVIMKYDVTRGRSE